MRNRDLSHSTLHKKSIITRINNSILCVSTSVMFNERLIESHYNVACLKRTIRHKTAEFRIAINIEINNRHYNIITNY